MLAGLSERAPEARRPRCADALPIGGRGTTVVRLEGVVMILDLHRQGLTISEIARQSGLDRKTVRRYIGRGLEPPTYGPRQPRPTLLDPFTGYLRERVKAYPGLTGSRLLRELRELG
jgi:transposase